MNNSINNKGFTLVELLATIVILISISLVAVVSISTSLGVRDEKECEEQKELAINAAKIYFSMEGGSSVSVATLKSKGYIKNAQKVDRLNGGTISIGSDSYTFTGTCN